MHFTTFGFGSKLKQFTESCFVTAVTAGGRTKHQCLVHCVVTINILQHHAQWRLALINMESRASLNSSTSDVLATNWKAPHEPARPLIMNLYLGGHHDVQLRRQTTGGKGDRGEKTMTEKDRAKLAAGWYTGKAPDAAASTTSTLESDVIQPHSRRAREPTRTGEKSGDCWACCMTDLTRCSFSLRFTQVKHFAARYHVLPSNWHLDLYTTTCRRLTTTL